MNFYEYFVFFFNASKYIEIYIVWILYTGKWYLCSWENEWKQTRLKNEE